MDERDKRENSMHMILQTVQQVMEEVGNCMSTPPYKFTSTERSISCLNFSQILFFLSCCRAQLKGMKFIPGWTALRRWMHVVYCQMYVLIGWLCYCNLCNYNNSLEESNIALHYTVICHYDCFSFQNYFIITWCFLVVSACLPFNSLPPFLCCCLPHKRTPCTVQVWISFSNGP